MPLPLGALQEREFRAATGIAGPAIAGALVLGVGSGYALAIDAAGFGVSAVFLAQLRLPAHVTLPPQSFLQDLGEGWREFVSRTWVWVIVVGASIGNMMSGVWYVLGAAFTKASHGGAVAWTAILVANSAGALVGGTLALRLRPRRPLLAAVIFLAAVVLPGSLFALRAPWQLIAVGVLLTGLGSMLFNTIWETTLQQHVPPQALSRVSAYDWFGSLLCQPIGFAVAGPVAVAVGMSATLWAAAAVSGLMVVLMLATPSIRKLEALS